MHVPTGLGRALYATAWTGSTASVALVRTAFGDRHAVRRGIVPWARRLASGIGMRVHAIGVEHVDPDRPHIFIANHQSHLDIPALLCALPVQPGFLAKQELRDVPVLGRAMEVSGQVFVDRSNRKAAFKAIKAAAAQVRDGASIVIFPEGTRSDGQRVKPFKKGGLHLARLAGVPISPVGIRGTAKLLAKNRRTVHPGHVEVHIGPAIDPKDPTTPKVDDLVARVRAEIGRLADLPLRDPAT